MSKILRISLLPRLLFVCGLILGVGLLGSRWWAAAPTLARHVAAPATTLPRPDHVVIVIEENHGYDQIIGASAAPYINRLAGQGALFTDAHGITHPSQPNYLALFSGATQGVHDDSCPHTFSAPNLGRALLDAGLTFAGYSENLPAVGSTVCEANGYVRKHNPWVNFTNVPATTNLPFDHFPADYRTWPTVAVVVPTEDNDMHSGSIQRGDTWLQQHLDGYVQWAQTHNSLFILTWDEDDFTAPNQIPTLFVGPMVRAGRYAEAINHYHVLRTLEDLYGLPYAGNSANVPPIADVWTTAGIPTATASARTATATP
ncbi:MAG TPA: alkaline phosphatase family protein, partial [Chloroflexia bacterium]|nr:alkaline phosphatase family protein [Chloroflexia bacterium]